MWGREGMVGRMGREVVRIRRVIIVIGVGYVSI